MTKTFNEYTLKKGKYLAGKDIRILSTLDSETLTLLDAETPLNEESSESEEA